MGPAARLRLADRAPANRGIYQRKAVEALPQNSFGRLLDFSGNGLIDGPLLDISRGFRVSRAAARKSALFPALLLGAAALTAPPAGAAQLEYPVDVAVAASGDIFVADLEAAALLRWTGSGYAVVVAGDGLPRTPLFGIRHIAPEPGGGIVASDPATMALYRISEAGAVERVPDDERFVTPWGVALGANGGVLVVDRVTQRLRRVHRGGVEDLAEIAAPRAILPGPDGELHVLTDRNILRMDGDSGHPLIQSPPFEFPHDFVRAPDGGFFVTDGYARCIWRVSAEGRVSVLARGEPLVSPQGLAVAPNGDLLVADAHARSVFRVSLSGEVRNLENP